MRSPLAAFDSFLRTHRSAAVGAAVAAPLVACVALSPVRADIVDTNAALGLLLSSS